jgi:hypothetical protein
MPNEAWGVGASLLRREDERHPHGRGEFVSDIKLPGTMVLKGREPMLHPGLRLSLGAALHRTEVGLWADLTVQLEAAPR